MRKKTTRRARRDEKQWAEVFRTFESSGLSVRDFCKREELALSSFQRWRRRLGSAAPSDFVELLPTAADTTSSAWSLEVSLPSGIALRFEG